MRTASRSGLLRSPLRRVRQHDQRDLGVPLAEEAQVLALDHLRLRRDPAANQRVHREAAPCRRLHSERGVVQCPQAGADHDGELRPEPRREVGEVARVV